jgi:hypothetical protein
MSQYSQQGFQADNPFGKTINKHFTATMYLDETFNKDFKLSHLFKILDRISSW